MKKEKIQISSIRYALPLTILVPAVLLIGIGIPSLLVLLAGCSGSREDASIVWYEIESDKQTFSTGNEAANEYSSISNEKYAWWFKRNDAHKQPEAQDIIDITGYDGWYVAPEQEEKVVYLTFDCGYENGYTEQMLNALKKYEVRAVFFITGHYAKDAAELVKRMKEDGHYVGNHTSRHPDLTGLTVRDVKLEIKDCEDIMYQYTGYAMDPLFRPPKGEYSERVLQVVKDMGYKTLFWSLAYVDYDVNNQPGKEYVIEHYKKYIHPGAVPLIHNVSESNAQALDQVLNDLKEAGYRFGDPMEIGE